MDIKHDMKLQAWCRTICASYSSWKFEYRGQHAYTHHDQTSWGQLMLNAYTYFIFIIEARFTKKIFDNFNRDDCFQFFNWFQLFSSKTKILKVAGYSRNRSKMTFLKGGVEWFQLISLIFIYFIFEPESYLNWVLVVI